MGTLADLVGGFQAGYTGVQDARRKRKVNQAIDYELGVAEEGRRGRKAGMERLGYGGMAADFTMPQTYGEKLAGKVRSFFGGGRNKTQTAIDPDQAAAPMAQAPMQPAGLQESGATTYGTEENRYRGGDRADGGAMRYRDGGAVRKFANGGRSLPPDRSAPPIPGVLEDTGTGSYAIPTPGRMMQSPGEQAIPFADGGAAGGRYADQTDEERAKRTYGEHYLTEEEAAELEVKPGAGMSGARTPRGRPGRQRIPTSGGGVGELWEDVKRSAGSVFDDTVKGALGGQKLIDEADAELDAAEGARAKGRASRSTGTAALTSAAETTAGLAKDVFVDNPITQTALGFLGYGGEEDGAKAAAVTEAVAPDSAAQPGETPPNTQTPQAKLAAAPAGPPDEIVDFTQVRDIMPEDLPNQSVKDWEDERMFWAAQAIAVGNDPHEAMKAVDERQMRGFNQYGQQAFQMLQNGDAGGAARALYAAYQYFPNGADVRFGIQRGKNGQPVLIGMGREEGEDGKPIGDPMVITPESLSVQLENMSNPSAFRTWTKDWRTAEQEIREYNEVTKPKAEAQITYQDRMGSAAQARAAGAGRGGLDQTDLDRANSAFMKAVELESFENEQQADFMMSLMAEIYQRHGGNVQYPSVIDDVRKAIRSGDFDELDQKYGQ